MNEETDEQLEQLKKEIITFIDSSELDSVEVNDISENLEYTGFDAFKKLVNAVAELEREGRIILTQQGRFKIKEAEPVLQGIFSATDRGFGFVSLEEYEEDIFIPPNKTGSALDGDLVAIEITEEAIPWQGKGPVGQITDVLERAAAHIVGEFHAYEEDEVEELDLFGFVTPKNKKFPDVLVQIEAKGIRPVDGSIVQVEITRYSRYQNEDMLGIVKSTIGHKDEPGIEILTIVQKYGIPSEFSEETIQEAEEVPDTITDEELKGRRDLRNEVIITIDGADAKDLDDAVVVKKMNNGNYHLGVHIADVTHYVKDGSALDEEAFDRGTSTYLTDRVIPMLPQRLSNGICSLHPNVDRLTLSCEMEIDHSGKVISHEIFPSVIRSYRRMTYDAVNKILMERDESERKEHDDLVPMFEVMEELHTILETKREDRGSIDFDTREAKIEVDPEGTPVDILLRERGVGERLIESFMLAANETVSEHYATRSLPILFRVHDRPDEAKMQRFLEFVTSFGINVKGTKDSISPKNLQNVLDKVKDKPEETVVSMLMLRSMQQAKYDVEAIGHYGLAADYYSHFTSPIRRYPDLVLHRQIHYYNEVGSDDKARSCWQKKLPEIAEHSSLTERRAVDAERETDELKKTEFMAGKVGEEFEGVITSVTNFGLFVQLPNSVEGLIHISSMKDDYYEFSERGLLMIGSHTGNIYRIGQSIKVKLISVDKEQYQIDFEIVESETKNTGTANRNKKAERKNQHKQKRKNKQKKQPNKKGRKRK